MQWMYICCEAYKNEGIINHCHKLAENMQRIWWYLPTDQKGNFIKLSLVTKDDRYYCNMFEKMMV